MASIVNRGKSYSVVYSYKNQNGVRQQKWVGGLSATDADALKREIEYKKAKGIFVAPINYTVGELLDEYVKYQVERNKWSLNYYTAVQRQIAGYIKPSFFGKLHIQDVRVKAVEDFYTELLHTPKLKQPIKGDTRFISAHGVKEIHKILLPAFSLAAKWEYIDKNPVCFAEKARHIGKERDIWDEDQIATALNKCTQPALFIAMHLAFSCTLREGEGSALTWDCVDIENLNMASLRINKTLCRVSKAAYEKLGGAGVIKVFESAIEKTGDRKTLLVLKEPKTPASKRTVYIPKTVAQILCDWKLVQEKLKKQLGSGYQDNNLVIAQENGHPIENRVMGGYLKELILKEKLPEVCFHSLRHSSVTYKLVISNGNIKAVQGDSGHTQARTVVQIYAHISDKERVAISKTFENCFYAHENNEIISKLAT